jgi:hypothetical protein
VESPYLTRPFVDSYAQRTVWQCPGLRSQRKAI